MSEEWDHIELGTWLSGKYEILERVASGGGGPVFSAVADEEFVQVHFFSKARYPDKDALKSGVDKAKEACTICPEVILAPSDHGFYEEIPYVVYDIADVKPLQHYLEPGNRFSGPEVQGFLEALFMMLDLVHEGGISHLGISPLSIYVREGGVGPLNVIVLDCCLAPRAGHGFYTGPAGDKELLSIASYVSPEQASSSGEADHRADLYAVGALVHRLILGREPFESETPEGIIEKVKGEAPAGLDESSTGISGGMREFLAKALDKDPEKRFQDGTEMMGAFSGAVAEEAEEAAGAAQEEAGAPEQEEEKAEAEAGQEEEKKEEEKKEEKPEEKLSLALPLTLGQKSKSAPQVDRDKLMSLFDRLQKEKQNKARPETTRKGPLDAEGLKALVAAGKKDQPPKQKEKENAPAEEEKPAVDKAKPGSEDPGKKDFTAEKRQSVPPRPPPAPSLFAPRKPRPPKPEEVTPGTYEQTKKDEDLEITGSSVDEVISGLAKPGTLSDEAGQTKGESSEPATFLESFLEDRKKVGIVTAVIAAFMIILGVVIIAAISSRDEPGEELEKLEPLALQEAAAVHDEPQEAQASKTPAKEDEKPIQEQPAEEPEKAEPVKPEPVKEEPAKAQAAKEEPVKKASPPKKEEKKPAKKPTEMKEKAAEKPEKKPGKEKKKKKKKKKKLTEELEYI